VIKGYVQSRIDGVSMRYSAGDPSVPSARRTQFYSMLGSRGIWHDGWKAITTHPTLSGWSHFNDDTWELYHVDSDRAELHDLAGEHPDKLRELVNLWYAEAGDNEAFPLDDRSALEIILTPRPQVTTVRTRYTYFPDTAEVPEAQAVNVRNRSFTIGAVVDIPGADATGVLFAQGARFGGHALYVKDNRLHYVNNFIGLTEQKVDGNESLPVGENLILSASFDKDGEDSPNVATGILSLFHGEKKVGEARIKTQPGMFSLAGEGLCVGRDSGAPVTGDYEGNHGARFTGGTIKRVVVDVSGDPYVDLEREAQAMLPASRHWNRSIGRAAPARRLWSRTGPVRRHHDRAWAWRLLRAGPGHHAGIAARRSGTGITSVRCGGSGRHRRRLVSDGKRRRLRL
jgi:arylsulfatase